MDRRSFPGALALLGVIACGGGAQTPPPETAQETQAPPPSLSDERRAVAPPPGSRRDAPGAASKQVGVRGIIGSLSAYEVNEAMQKRTGDLLACVQRRPGRLGYVEGRIRFHFIVGPDGSILKTHVMESSLGNRKLEDCLASAAGDTHMPVPAGSTHTEARWDMSVEPMGKVTQPLEDEEHLQTLKDAIRASAEGTYETCEIQKRHRFQVTAYLGRKGRVLSAGVQPRWRGSEKTDRDDEQLACLTKEIRGWKGLPRVKGRRKVAFELRWSKAPPPKKAKKRKKKRRKKKRRG